MQKIILFLLLSFSFIVNAKANLNPNAYSINNNDISICMDNESYAIKKMTSPYGNLYFLNASHDYNYHLEDYYAISWEDSPYDKNISEYASYYHKHRTKSYYYESTVKMLWSALYPERLPHFCSSFPNLDNAMAETEDLMRNIEAGPEFINYPHYLKENEEVTFPFRYLDDFIVASADGIEVVKSVDKMTVKAKNPGKYEVILKRRSNGTRPGKLYTDGTNYLITNGPFPDKEYKATFYVGYKKLIFIPRNESGSAQTFANFTLYKDNEKYLDIKTNSEGVYEGYLPVDEYYIQNESGTFKEYFFMEDDFTLDTFVKSNNNPVVSSSEDLPIFIQNAQNLAVNTFSKEPEKVKENVKEEEEVSIIFPDTLWLT